MNHFTIHIKNMVCPRCITTVYQICNELGIDVKKIELGEVVTTSMVTDHQKKILGERLRSNGFELLQDQKSRLVNQIKTLIINQIHHSNEPLKVNFSNLLAEKLLHEYTSMSRLFSQVEGITIERFILKQKIERVKELIFYEELTLSEIAFKMNYSSVAHLSAQFKKETGMTPSEFKRLKKPGHQSLDEL